jgi:phosphopantothenoylcysteine decarboxylase / phosphopantothenate---cysteine ligase
VRRKKVLITSGPTSVPIDDMRVITNRSTGEMGRLLARAFASKDASVTLLEGSVTTGLALPKDVRVRKFYLFGELEKALRVEFEKKPDIVIHAAAVSDFAMQKSFKGKLSSSDKVRLDLVPTRKLVNGIKRSCPKTFLVGFKFEPVLAPQDVLKKTRTLFGEAKCDIVVANSLQKDRYRACLVFPDGSMSGRVSSKQALVRLLVKGAADLIGGNKKK